MEKYVFGLVDAAFRNVSASKSDRADVLDFTVDEYRNCSELAHNLVFGTYQHGAYSRFIVSDPKRRVINTASLRDRIVHRLVYDALTPMFEPRFFHDSYAARVGKGVHRARLCFSEFLSSASRNQRDHAFVLHGDVASYFESVDHELLLDALRRVCRDGWLMNVVECVVRSYGSGKGMPIGNVTSQLFANVYLHELDRYVKHELLVQCYLRYNDDFFIVSSSPARLSEFRMRISEWLRSHLRLRTTFALASARSGVDVLGAVAFPYGLVPRITTRRNMDMLMKNRGDTTSSDMRAVLSYSCLLSHPVLGYWMRERLLGSVAGI